MSAPHNTSGVSASEVALTCALVVLLFVAAVLNAPPPAPVPLPGCAEQHSRPGSDAVPLLP